MDPVGGQRERAAEPGVAAERGGRGHRSRARQGDVAGVAGVRAGPEREHTGDQGQDGHHRQRRREPCQRADASAVPPGHGPVMGFRGGEELPLRFRQVGAGDLVVVPPSHIVGGGRRRRQGGVGAAGVLPVGGGRAHAGEDAQALAVRVDPVDQARPGGEEDLVGGGDRVTVHGEEAGVGEGGGDDEEVLGQLGERGVATDGSGGADVDEPEEECPAVRPSRPVEFLVDGLRRRADGAFDPARRVVVVHGDPAPSAALPAHEQHVRQQRQQRALVGAGVGGGDRVEQEVHQ